MPTTEHKENDQEITTLAGMLYRCTDPEVQQELEQFRIEYEQENGPTDLTKRYTSLWPEVQQAWMIENQQKRYWDGLPEFVQAFIRGKMERAHQAGTLENQPDSRLITLYLQKQMTIGGDERNR
jgi:hypothetical protein